jgi:azurin
MKTKNVYYSEKQAQRYRNVNERGGMPNLRGGLSMMALNQIRLDDGRVVAYTEICDGESTSLWDDLKLIGSIAYDGDFDYSRCTAKGYW